MNDDFKDAIACFAFAFGPMILAVIAVTIGHMLGCCG